MSCGTNKDPGLPSFYASIHSLTLLAQWQFTTAPAGVSLAKDAKLCTENVAGRLSWCSSAKRVGQASVQNPCDPNPHRPAPSANSPQGSQVGLVRRRSSAARHDAPPWQRTTELGRRPASVKTPPTALSAVPRSFSS